MIFALYLCLYMHMCLCGSLSLFVRVHMFQVLDLTCRGWDAATLPRPRSFSNPMFDKMISVCINIVDYMYSWIYMYMYIYIFKYIYTNKWSGGVVRAEFGCVRRGSAGFAVQGWTGYGRRWEGDWLVYIYRSIRRRGYIYTHMNTFLHVYLSTCTTCRYM